MSEPSERDLEKAQTILVESEKTFLDLEVDPEGMCMDTLRKWIAQKIAAERASLPESVKERLEDAMGEAFSRDDKAYFEEALAELKAWQAGER